MIFALIAVIRDKTMMKIIRSDAIDHIVIAKILK
jgi:hypothetical protein